MGCYYLSLLNYFYFFYFLLGKGGSDQSLGDGRKMPPGLLAVGGTPKPHKLPRAAVRGPAVGGEPPVRWAAGYGFPPRLIVRTLGRLSPLSIRVSPVHHPHAPGAAPPPSLELSPAL